MAKKTGWTDLGFIIKQDAANTLKKPVGAGVLAFIAPPKFVQDVEMLANPERIDSWDETDQLRDAQPAGEFEFTIFLKLNGTGATETYTLLPHTTERSVYSIFYRTGDGFVMQMADCLFRTLKIVRVRRGIESILQATFGGGFMKQRRLGKTVTIAGSSTTVINLTVGHAKFFEVGGYVDIGVDTGVLISAVDTTADTITVPVLGAGAPAAGVAVIGHIPVASHSGNKISGWRGVATYGGVNYPHTRFELNVTNSIDILDDEVTGTDWPTSFLEGVEKRMVTAVSTVYFDKTSIGGMDAWHDALNQTRKALAVPIGDVTDNIVTVNIPRAELSKTPDLDTSGKIYLTRTWRAFADSSLNNSVNITTDSPMPTGPRSCMEGVMGIVT
jgi:hypothetical protein